MTRHDDEKRKTNRFKLLPGSHEVGYGRPPAATRFVKGQSGNPAGRPRGSKNKPAQLGAYDLHGIILSEATRDIEIRERGDIVKMPAAQGVTRRIVMDAMQGRPRAQELFIRMTETARSAAIQLNERHLQAACEYKVAGEQELRRRARLGITHLPDLLPHPDDIVINLQTGEVEMHGPMTREEEVQYEALRKHLIVLQEGLPHLDAMLKEVRPSKRRTLLEEMKQNVLERIAEIEAVLPAAYIARKGKAEAASQE